MSKSEFTEIMSGLEEAIAHAKGESAGVEHRVTGPLLDVAAVRERLGMTQEEFAATFGVSVATLRNWEQGRRLPRGPARVLLQVIAQEPAAVKRVLSDLSAA